MIKSQLWNREVVLVDGYHIAGLLTLLIIIYVKYVNLTLILY